MITPTVSLDPRSIREILPPVPPFPKDQIAKRTIPSPRRTSPFSPPSLHPHQRQHQRRHSHHRQHSHSHSDPHKHHQHHHGKVQQIQEQQQPHALTHEALKTSREQAKLDRRRYEHAMLRDALRRGVPYLYIPGLLARGNQTPEATSPAGSGSSPTTGSEHISGSTGHPPRNIDVMTNPNANFNQTHSVISPGNHGPGIENIDLNGNGSITAPPPVRRLNLDDSFLRRAYKRRRSWGATAKGRAAADSQHQRGRSSGQISFHHWVPRGGEGQKV